MRGVGKYTMSMAESIAVSNRNANIFIWADYGIVPQKMKDWRVRWIPYKKGTWKSSLVYIPYLVRKYRIDIFQYWVALGPLWQIGLSYNHGCSTIATVFDVSVALWKELQFLEPLRKSWYWKMQKVCVGNIDTIVCPSRSTSNDINKAFTLKQKQRISIQRPPLFLHFGSNTREKRLPYFITLGGAEHKNVANVLMAFSFVRKRNKRCTLIVLGTINRGEEHIIHVPEGVTFETMDLYEYHLQHASGLVFCSFKEGFGLPPLEAIGYGCPIILSAIPPLKEIYKDIGRFVDPYNPFDIENAMTEVLENTGKWSALSKDGARGYRRENKNSGERWIQLYESTMK